ncbi:uncharacterized protein LOC124368248 [Homalodisca vitripennis]|uniref:uncharacterized protein LOC124368248 n=1 Tax=Homalodisca vitripennis TaxID=197043 RepID=UPI001EEB72A7|nr:uncharacterized protein LOC124368248 [Homalodisca vitripennis]
MDCQTTYRSNGKEKEQDAFKRSSIMQRSPTLTTGTPTRVLKTSPPPVPFKAVSNTGSSSGSGKRKEEVDLAMEVTNPETPQGIPPSNSSLRAAFGLQMLQQQHDDASEEEDLSLKKMKALLKEMAKALLTQRNVNKAIKDGIPKLDDFLGEIEECRKIRLKAVKQGRDIMNRVISDSPQAQAYLAESQTQARKRVKRQRGSSPGSPELRELDPAPNPVFFSASTQTEDVPAADLVPAPVGVPAPAAALIPASIPSTPLNSQGPAPQTPLGNWERRLSKKERRQLKRAEAASKKTPAKGKKKVQVSEPVKETPSKTSRKPSRPRLKKPRPEAILIKPLGGRSFADVLGQIKTQAKPEETETTIKSIRRTQNGDVLLELGKSRDKDGFAASLKAALGDKGSIRTLQPRCSVEIRDLDALSTEDEVIKALKKALPELPGEAGGLKVWLTKPNRSQQRMAIAELGEKHANKLLSLQHLRFGWVSCRLKQRVIVQRCYRCLAFGHSSRTCRGPDRSFNCLRCGDQGHKKKDCTSSLSCFLCKETGSAGNALGHLPGSGKRQRPIIRILQANLQRSWGADNLLNQQARELGVDALLVSEQYRDRDPGIWIPDSLGTAAFWARNSQEVMVRSHGRGRGFVWIRCRDVTFFSCYLTPNEAIQDFRDKIDRLEESVLGTTGHVVVGGDFNARAVEWGMPSTNSRGKYILDFIARAGLVVLNQGDTPTFRRPGQRGTIPDVTFASESLLSRISGWRVVEDYTGSDHQYIVFDLHDLNRRVSASRDGPRRWNTNKLDVVKFTEVISRGAQANPGEAGAKALVTSTMELFVSACDRSMPRKKLRRDKQPIYWWTEEIAELRRTCLRAKRAATRIQSINADDITLFIAVKFPSDCDIPQRSTI